MHYMTVLLVATPSTHLLNQFWVVALRWADSLVDGVGDHLALVGLEEFLSLGRWGVGREPAGVDGGSKRGARSES